LGNATDIAISGWKKHGTTALLFLLTALALRFLSLFPAVINHDESTYIVIADALLNGQTYWIDVVDTKPVGIFLVYAGLEWLFGSSIFALRVFATLMVVLTAYGVYRAKLQLGSHPGAARAAGMIFIFLCSLFTFYGVSPNTETYFVALTALAFWLISGQPSSLRSWMAGVLLGIGFVIKYVVLFDALAFAALLLLRDASWRTFWRQWVPMGVGMTLPFLSVLWYYAQLGALDTFLFYTFELSSRYPETSSFMDYVKSPLDFFLRFFPVTLLLGSVLLHRFSFPYKHWGVLWGVLVLIIVLLPGTFYGHYYIQLMLPVSFLAGEAFGVQTDRHPRWLRWFLRPVPGGVFLGMVLILNWVFQKKDYLDRRDYPRILTEYISPHLDADDQVYFANDAHIGYFLLDRLSPIKYVHPSLFWSEKHVQALDINVSAQMDSLKASDPEFILFKQDDRLESRALFWSWLQAEYQLESTIDRFQIYRSRASTERTIQ